MSLTDSELFDLRLLREATRYQKWVVESFGTCIRGEVLEVGAGLGNFTRWLTDAADRVVAVEPDGDMCREITALGLAGVEVVEAPLEDLEARYDGFDAVVLFNVLEHFEDDVAAVIEARSRLRDGGSVCVFVPAHQFLFGSLDRRYDHVRRYSTRDVEALLDRAGLRAEVLRYFNPLGALGWFLAGRVARRPNLDPAAVRLSERLAVPVGRWLERAGVPAPFGQSVLAVGRANGT